MLRIAVVEIGSRALRLLVADIGADTPMRVARTGTEQVNLAAALKEGPASVVRALSELQRALGRLCRLATENRAERISIFGTEAVRRIEAEYPEALRAIGYDIEVLSREGEAGCAFAAALSDPAIQAIKGRQYVVIDVGNGSIETTAGSFKQGKPTVSKYASLPLGISMLVSEFARLENDLGDFRLWLGTELSNHEIPEPSQFAKTILLGSAPTKAAWIKNRPSPSDTYNPKFVAGVEISRSEIATLVSSVYAMWLKSPNEARRFVDYRIKDDSEVLMLICGSILVDGILGIQRRSNCVVSCQGVRFGYVYQAAADLF